MTTELNKLTKAQLLALIESGALKPARVAKVKTAYRITNADKSCMVGTPIKEEAPEFAKGRTFAVWIENIQGESVKRRAYDGGSFLVIDTRAIVQADVVAIAQTWAKGRKLVSKTIGLAHVFTVATPAKAAK